MLEELLKQSLSLAHPTFAKVGAKEGAHVFHFAVHNLAVSIHHIGGKHHERGEKVVRGEIVALAKHFGVGIAWVDDERTWLATGKHAQGAIEEIAYGSSENCEVEVAS